MTDNTSFALRVLNDRCAEVVYRHVPLMLCR